MSGSAAIQKRRGPLQIDSERQLEGNLELHDKKKYTASSGSQDVGRQCYKDTPGLGRQRCTENKAEKLEPLTTGAALAMGVRRQCHAQVAGV